MLKARKLSAKKLSSLNSIGFPVAVVQAAIGIELAERVYPEVCWSRGFGQVNFEDITIVAGINTSVYGGAQFHKRGSVKVVPVVVFNGLSPGSSPVLRISREADG